MLDWLASNRHDGRPLLAWAARLPPRAIYLRSTAAIHNPRTRAARPASIEGPDLEALAGRRLGGGTRRPRPAYVTWSFLHTASWWP